MSDHRTFTLDEIEKKTGFDKRTIAYYVQQGLLPKVGRRGPKTRYPQLFLDRLQFVNMIRKKQDLGEIGSLTLADIADILNRVSAETIAGVVAGEEPLKVVDRHSALQPLVSKPPATEPLPMPVQNASASPALAAEAAEISESLMEPAFTGRAALDERNRPVRLGLMDANVPNPRGGPREITTERTAPSTTGASAHDGGGGDGFTRPARRYEDEIKKKEASQAANEQPPAEETEAPDAEAKPPSIEIERLGWFLARLQHALTGDRRRRTGTTESWHRALVTPELTISARNLKDADAHMLDAVARILKKLLWEAWEE